MVKRLKPYGAWPLIGLISLLAYFGLPRIDTNTSKRTTHPTTVEMMEEGGLEKKFSVDFIPKAYALEEGNFNHLVPDLTGYQFSDGWDTDVDENATNESYVRVFENAAGDKIFKYTAGKDGPVWAWGKLHHNKDPNDIVNNYGIIKSTSTSGFNRLIRIDQEFYVGEWVKRGVK